jgi:hypothetical protein
MQPLILPPLLAERLSNLYAEMEAAYDEVAGRLEFSCTGCPDNCCDSYFLHYTYVEWAYLWQGFEALDEQPRQAISAHAADYILRSEAALARGERPMTMCPLNEAGLCLLYEHRLMICRLHGVPSAMTMPDGRAATFPGCFRCQKITAGRQNFAPLDRTAFFRRLVDMETELRRLYGPPRPRLKMTIARMLVEKPPSLVLT